MKLIALLTLALASPLLASTDGPPETAIKKTSAPSTQLSTLDSARIVQQVDEGQTPTAVIELKGSYYWSPCDGASQPDPLLDIDSLASDDGRVHLNVRIRGVDDSSDGATIGVFKCLALALGKYNTKIKILGFKGDPQGWEFRFLRGYDSNAVRTMNVAWSQAQGWTLSLSP